MEGTPLDMLAVVVIYLPTCLSISDDLDEETVVDSELTAAETLAKKANHARAMAKSVKSAQFKKKTAVKALKKSRGRKPGETRGRKPLSHPKHAGKQDQVHYFLVAGVQLYTIAFVR